MVNPKLKILLQKLERKPVLNVNFDYSALEMRVLRSICDKCPVCGEPIIDIKFFPGFSLEGHLAEQTDNAHAVFEVMSL
jgi:hypothetical protein